MNAKYRLMSVNASTYSPSPAAFFTMNLAQATYRKDNHLSQPLLNDGKIKDNIPWASASTFGKNATHNYYYLGDPSKYDLYKCARYTEFGYRLTYGTVEDALSNDFEIEVDGLDEEDNSKINKELTMQLKRVKFYDEFRKAAGFDSEQGESLLFIHRRGQDSVSIATDEADLDAEVVRVEAINYIDYDYSQQGEEGKPDSYQISFYTDENRQQTFYPLASHAVRVRARNLDYDSYHGQAVLKALYGSLQIILMITRACGDAAFRWSLGMLGIGVKGLKDASDAEEIRSKIGNPTSQAWFLYPADVVDKIEAFGLAGQMMNLQQLYDICLNNICAVEKIPKSIIIGDSVGVIEGSRVFERSYYAKLSNLQKTWEKFIREYLYLDPNCRNIIGNREYKIKWGLRQVMTDKEKAELNATLYSNANLISGYSTYNEVRKEAQKPYWEEVYNTPELIKFHKDLFGLEPWQIGILPYEIVVGHIFNPIQQNSKKEEENLDDNDDQDESDDDQDIPDELDDLDNTPDDELLSEARKVADAIVTYHSLCPNADQFAQTLGVSRTTGSNIFFTLKNLIKNKA